MSTRLFLRSSAYLVRPVVLLSFLYFLFPSTGYAQLVDVNACSGNLTRCVTRADSSYLMCFNVIPASICAYKKFTINWGDGTGTETVQGPGPVKVEHRYNLVDFVKNCRYGGVSRYNIEIITDCPGDNIVRKLTFIVRPELSIDFPDVCEGKPVYIRNNSCPSSSDIVNDVTYKWDFGDGTTATSPSPSHTFPATKPIYTVTVSATSSCGSDTKQFTVPVRKTPVASYSATGYTIANQDTVVCLDNGGTLALDGTISIDESRYQWTISPSTYKFLNNTNSSSPVIKLQFLQSGEYTITLIALNDCGTSKPLVCKHRVVTNPVVAITPKPDACEATTYTLVNPTPLAVYTLTNGPNTQTLVANQTVPIPISAEPYIVRASLTNLCGSTKTVPDSFYVQLPQPVQITAPGRQTQLCAGGATIPLTTNLPGGTWTGTGREFLVIRNGTSFFNPKTVGTFDLIYTRGSVPCQRADTIRLTVSGAQVTVNDLSACSSQNRVKLPGSPAGGIWTTADCINCIRNDSLVLTSLTKNTVSITYSLTSTVGCSAAATFAVSIGQPKAQFSLSGQCSTQSVVVTNTSTGASSYEWILNSTTIATGQKPSLTLPPGQQTVTLRALAGSCQNETQQTVTLIAPPTAPTATPSSSSGCSPLSMTFTTTGLAQPDVTYRWDYGDGSVALPAPVSTHVYVNNGSTTQPFTATLSAFNSCGTTTSLFPLVVRPRASASIGLDSTNVRCTPALIRFANRSVGQDQASLWSFGDGITRRTSQDTVMHYYASPDSARTFRIRLTVQNSCSIDSDVVAVRLYPTLVKPGIGLSTVRPCAGEPVQFNDTSVPRPTAWVWQFSDGTTETVPNPRHRFPDANKEYLIKLTVQTPCGSNSRVTSLTTVAPPTARFSIAGTQQCQGQPVTLTNLSDPAYRFRWDFGDGSPLDSVNYSPRHVFKGNRTSVPVSLTVLGATPGCATVQVNQVTLRPQLSATFSVAEGKAVCTSEPVHLIAADNNATQFRWSLSNGTVLTTASPAISLPPGLYDAALTVSYEQGACADSSLQVGAINVLPCAAVAPDAFTPNGDGTSPTWTIFGDLGVVRIQRLRIWNRWGEVIFDVSDIPLNSSQPGECWDGTNRGTPMPAGQYTYEATVLLREDKLQRLTGSIALIR